MLIQILGPGCAKCEKLAQNAKAAATALGVEFEIEKIADFQRISEFGVMFTPALAVDGIVKFQGKLLEPKAIEAYLK